VTKHNKSSNETYRIKSVAVHLSSALRLFIEHTVKQNMWLAKYILFYLLTLFNSLDGYYLDDKHSQNTGRHRRKGKLKQNKFS
jgi:hypothetical protein